ncbi:hypothetical protein WDW89_21070 [Deltaproteobacteria bacterium TL4]
MLDLIRYRNVKCLLILLFGTGLFVMGTPVLLYAQTEDPNAPAVDNAANVPVEDTGTAASSAAPGGAFWRVAFYEVLAQRFLQHPFYRMTGNWRFKEGAGSLNSSQDNIRLLSTEQDLDRHDQVESDLQRLTHSLPVGSVEYITPTNLIFITGVSVMAGYTNTWLMDNVAKITKNDPISSTPIIRLRSHFFYSAVSVYLFSPPQADTIDFYYGLGYTYVESTLRTGFRRRGTRLPIPTSTVEELNAYVAEKPLFLKRIGMASSGENFGFSFETIILDNTPILENPFYDSPLIKTRPLDKKINIGGILLRATVIYSFW